MFHIYQLSSVNAYPIYASAGTSVSIGGVSVFYIEEMEALSCTTCVSIGNIYLAGASIFLLNKGNFKGSTGFAFGGSGSGSSNWFGIICNTFNVTTAVSGSSSPYYSYMSIFGNYYVGSWSQRVGTRSCYAMCDSQSGNLVSSPTGGCFGDDCTPTTLCGNIYPQCYNVMASLTCVNQKPSCVCTNSIATTEFCIPFAAPKIPTCVYVHCIPVLHSLNKKVTIVDQVQLCAFPLHFFSIKRQHSVSQ